MYFSYIYTFLATRWRQGHNACLTGALTAEVVEKVVTSSKRFWEEGRIKCEVKGEMSTLNPDEGQM